MAMGSKRGARELLVASLACVWVVSAGAGETPRVDDVPVPAMKAAVDTTLGDCGSPDGCFSIEEDKVVRHARGGQEVWATELPGGLGAWRGPGIVHDQRRVYVAHADGITALDVSDGTELWHVAGPNNWLFVDDGVLVMSGRTGASGDGTSWLMGRRPTDGAATFMLPLPKGLEDPYAIWGFGGLVVVVGHGADLKGATLIVDGRGNVQDSLNTAVYAGSRVQEDVLLVGDGEVTRIALGGRIRWTIRSLFSGGGPVGGAGLVAVPGGGLLEYEYFRDADSGVGVRRIDPDDGKVKWEYDCKGLGVNRSRYAQQVTAVIEGGQAKITSDGSSGTFTEWLDLEMGQRVSRVVNGRSVGATSSWH